MAFSRNVGSTDKIIRLLAGAALIAFGILNGFSTTVGIIMGIVGAVLIVTGLINFCPLFKILNISSYRIADK